MATSKASLKVELPKPGEDKPRFSRVGIITAVGFGLGVLWPRLAGVHLVPSAPAEEVAGVSSAAEEAAPAGSGDPTPPAAACTRGRKSCWTAFAPTGRWGAG